MELWIGMSEVRAPENSDFILLRDESWEGADDIAFFL